MDSKTNVPASVPLDDRSLVYLSVVLAWYQAFPSELRKHTRLQFDLHRSLQSARISAYGLLGAAYLGFAPLPTSYGRFMTHARRINKLQFHAESAAFSDNPVAREGSAASQFEVSRGEFKRLLALLDEFAERCIGVESYNKTFNCKDEILKDTSPFAPSERENYAEGPLYIWDFAKAVNEQQLTNMRFGTFDDWILFVHLERGVVAGHAFLPVALRHGDLFENPFSSEIKHRLEMGVPTDCIDVPNKVLMAVQDLANRHFPDKPIKLIPPPMIHAGQVMPTWGGQTVLRSQSKEH